MEQQYREGSAVAGLSLNCVSAVAYPSFLFGAAYNWRQKKIAGRTKEMLKQAMQDRAQAALGTEAPVVGHVKGQFRCFLCGAGMKVAVFVIFLGHIHAEDFIIQHLNPAHILAQIPDIGPELVQSPPVLEAFTQGLHGAVHGVFEFPHAFNDIPIVAALQEIGNAPQEMVGFSGFQTWVGCAAGPAQLVQQVAVGPVLEVNLPAMIGEQAMEKVAEDWSKRPKPVTCHLVGIHHARRK